VRGGVDHQYSPAQSSPGPTQEVADYELLAPRGLAGCPVTGPLVSEEHSWLAFRRLDRRLLAMGSPDFG
jgi:hypothetical protein